MNATHCYLCEDEIEDNSHIQRGCKVRDHCHITGTYRGCAHNICNLHCNNKDFRIPVLFHNLKGYVSHSIICNAHEFQSKQTIDVIAQNSAKLIMFGSDNLQCKGSFSFLNS